MEGEDDDEWDEIMRVKLMDFLPQIYDKQFREIFNDDISPPVLGI